MLNMIESVAFLSFSFLFPCDILFSCLVGRNGQEQKRFCVDMLIPHINCYCRLFCKFYFLFPYILLCALRQHTSGKC
ncbi:hypothetical protein BDV24DRAFT_138657 [Aspergillus arachidicola]|uniref:Uncharacterized protein n=1 Tax=Aspergillus arachidicola TaxID=656916 RepID=A0A5N6Y386_9EURO|nr:hypothetical protein BDV24DRAFT_138657 [Aspergillus arachidicola]